MKTAFASTIAALALTATPALAGGIVIEGVRISREVDCGGQDVVIAGQGNTIALTGACGAVQVMGSDHKVTFESAKALQVAGASIAATGGKVEALAVDVTDNTVKATVASSHEPAEVRIFGADQKSELRFESAAAVTVGGAANELVWTADKGVKPPSISSLGVDLKITRK
ncbi:DUF3060 domain-containing protein [Methylopila sp. M107]|uniref:DUF3060 domain-containing protein n=1 Tax=Methylopila sp. M107 TaxID=1101190 RepID=UPI00037BE9DD|nr:DUF3060 domain-containing protein [Methylopila sp. M107]